jgi:cobalt-zinc-cadmium efflux system membrane fusion protein
VQGYPAFALLSLLVAASLTACARSEGAAASHERTSASDPAISGTTVQLSPSQLSAITVEPAGTYAFPLDKAAVGTVSYEESLPIIQAEAALLSAAAAHEQTGKELIRVQSLAGDNGLSARELEQAVADHQAAASTLRAARDAVRALGKTDAQIDQLIATRQIATPVQRGATKWLLVHVIESDSPYIHRGLPLTAKLMALPGRRFAGRVDTVYANVDPDTHRVPIRCELTDPGNELRPGMLVDALIRVRAPVSSVAIPVNGVVREGDGSMTAWVTTDHRHFSQRRIELGLRQDGRVQILSGLAVGELVVTENAVFLSNMLQAPPSD